MNAKPRPRSAADTSPQMRRASERELERLTAARARLATQADSLRTRLANLDEQIREIDALTRLLLNFTGGELSDYETHAHQEATGGILRGAALAERAVQVLRATTGGGAHPIHYRDWYALCEQQGVVAAGLRPATTFLTALTRSPMVRAAEGGHGRYQLDLQAPRRLHAELGQLRLEMQQVQRLQRDLREATTVTGRGEKLVAAREHHDTVARKIARVERHLAGCARALTAAAPAPETPAAPPPAARSEQQAPRPAAEIPATEEQPPAAATPAQPPEPPEPPEPLEVIVYEVGRRFHATASQIRGTDPAGATARNVAMRLARAVLGMSYGDVGAAFGRDAQAARDACELTAGFILDDVEDDVRDTLGIEPKAIERTAFRPTPVLRIEVIIDTVTAHFKTTRDLLLGRGRQEPVVTARLIAIRLACEFTDLSYPQVGAQFGGRDHSTIISAWRSAAALPLLTEVRRKVRDAIAAVEGDASDLDDTTVFYQEDPAAVTAGRATIKPRDRLRSQPASMRRRRGSQ